MSGSVNKVILIGNVGKKPEIRTSQDGAKRFANFSLATSENWTDKSTGEKKTKTEWHNIVVSVDALVGIVEAYIDKGTKLFIEGSLHTRKWTDKVGNERYTTEVRIDNFKNSITIVDNRNNNSSVIEQEVENDFN
jgi:single-strand DNA-binding protein